MFSLIFSHFLLFTHFSHISFFNNYFIKFINSIFYRPCQPQEPQVLSAAAFWPAAGLPVRKAKLCIRLLRDDNETLKIVEATAEHDFCPKRLIVMSRATEYAQLPLPRRENRHRPKGSRRQDLGFRPPLPTTSPQKRNSAYLHTRNPSQKSSYYFNPLRSLS